MGDKRKHEKVDCGSDDESSTAKPEHRASPPMPLAANASHEATPIVQPSTAVMSSHRAFRRHLMELNEVQAQRRKQREERRATPY